MEDTKMQKMLQEYSFKEILTKVKNFGDSPKKAEKVATHAKRAIDHMAHNLGFISTDSLKKDYKSKKVDFGAVKKSAANQPEVSFFKEHPSMKKRLSKDHPVIKQDAENETLKKAKIRNHPAQNLEIGKEKAGQAEINRRKDLYSKPYRSVSREDRQVDANFAKWTSKKNKPTIESIVDKYLSNLDEDSRRKTYYPGRNPALQRIKKGLVNSNGYEYTAKGAAKQASQWGRVANGGGGSRYNAELDAQVALHLSPNRPKKKGDVEILTRGAIKESTLEGVVSNFLEGTNTIVANFARVRQQLKSKQETTPSVKAFAAKLSVGSKSKLAPGSETPNNPERVSSKINRGIPFATQTASRLLRGTSGEREAASSYLDNPTFQRNKMSPKEQTDMLRGAINKYVKKEESVLDEDQIPTHKQIRAIKTKRFLKGEIKSDGSATSKGIYLRTSSNGRTMKNDDNPINHRYPFSTGTKYDAEKLISKTNRPQKKGDIETLTHGGIKEKAIVDNFLANLDETPFYTADNLKKRVKEGKVPEGYTPIQIKKGKDGVPEGKILKAKKFQKSRASQTNEGLVSEADHKKYKKGLEKQGAQTRATNAKMVHHGEMEPTNSRYKQGKLTPKGEYKNKRSKEREDNRSLQTEDTLTGDVAIMPMPFKKKKHKKGIIAAMMGAATTGS